MILLDDAQSTAANPTSRLYTNPSRYWQILPSGDDAADVAAIQSCLSEISEILSKGKYVVAAFAYEMGRIIHQIPAIRKNDTAHPLIEAWSFDGFEKHSKKSLDRHIQAQINTLSAPEQIAGVLNVKKSIGETQFVEDLMKIQEYIRSGDTYQINHTYRIDGQAYGAPLALYKRLRERQPGRYGAYIQHQSRYLLSQSPELFIERKGETFKAMPMKGTASALSDSSSALSEDPKNQAENVMIVDLLRNDLSRISLPNTVTVPHLFSVARHGDVLQMTSTVQGQARPHTTLMDIFTAVFPCGSVTGAPKKRSMEIIQELESSSRGYYCGALGWLDPNGDFAFSVPIRTIELQKEESSHAAVFTMGVGAGITIDSDAKQEWQECQIKSDFLLNLPSATGLFETIAIIQNTPQRLERHLDRIQSSAAALRIPFDRLTAKTLVINACSKLSSELPYRLRLDLSVNGELNVSTGALDPLPEVVKIFWASDLLSEACTIYSGDPLLTHKVSQRALYDAAWQTAVQQGGFDALFVNEQGYVTEGGRTSIFIKSKTDSQWLTPPITAGLLPGVMRAELLKSPQWNAREANLTIEDVSMADEIILCNALRGTIKAHF